MLKKLSLAALIAMGSMSVASATPLTEAIKGVDFSGYLRLRVYNDKKKSQDAVNRYRTTALFKFVVPVSEDLKFVNSYALDWSIYSDGTTTDDIASGQTPTNVKFFLQYKKDKLTALVGKIPVPTPVTATGVGEATAAGAIALFKASDNLTLVAAGLDAMVGTDDVTVGGNNTYAAAAIFSNDNVKAQLWYFNVDNIINSDVVAMITYKTKELTINLNGAVADLDKTISSKTQQYYNISAKYSNDKMCAKVGYVATGKDGGTVVLDGDSPLAAVLPTPQKTGIANTTNDYAFYGKVGFNVSPKTNVYVAYSDADKAFDSEIALGGSYKYTKKMKISAYYSILNAATDNNEARVEFKYSF